MKVDLLVFQKGESGLRTGEAADVFIEGDKAVVDLILELLEQQGHGLIELG